MIDARGRLLGMSTFGPRRSVLVIPAATIARVAAALLETGQVARGWLGVGLHPVALPRDLIDRAGARQRADGGQPGRQRAGGRRAAARRHSAGGRAARGWAASAPWPRRLLSNPSATNWS